MKQGGLPSRLRAVAFALGDDHGRAKPVQRLA
jgi:hypothetical protein